VVDVPVRAMHWLMAFSFIGAYLTADGERWRLVHVSLGYTLAGLLVARLLWGVFGPRPARLSSLWRRVNGTPAWLKAAFTGRIDFRQGQNLLLAGSIVLLLALIAPPARGDGFVDPHVWLDPRLAAVTAAAMARVLEERGLVDAAEIAPRLQAFQDRMARVEEDIAASLRGLEGVPFAAMHDGYAYFVQRFGLRQATVLALDAEQQVGAHALAHMRREVRDSAAVCLLRERSGDNARLAEMIAEGSAMRVVELDSLASDAPDDADGYALFLEDFARAVAGCLRGPAS